MRFDGLSWYASPEGTPRGDGSESSPWDLSTALSHPSVVEPGDVVWILPGTYWPAGRLTSVLTGVEGRPVAVRGWPGSRPVLDFRDSPDEAGLVIQGAYVRFHGLELANSRTVRWSDATGAEGDPRGTGIRGEASAGLELTHLVVRDFGTSLFESQPSGMVIHGCLFCDSYWDAPDRSHGPGLYVRNQAGAPRKTIENSVIFQHGRQGLQGFGSVPFANVEVRGNVFFNNGIGDDGFHRNWMFGNASDDHRDVAFVENTSYFAPAPELGSEFNLMGGDGGCHDLEVRGNWIAHEGREAVNIQRCDGAVVEGNRIVGGLRFTSFDESVEASGSDFRARFPTNEYFDDGARPTGAWVRVRSGEYLPDGWEPRDWALATVVNWDASAEATADLSAVVAAGRMASDTVVTIRSCQDLSVSIDRACDAGMLTLPMTGWGVRVPVGRDVQTRPLPATFPEFGAFWLEWDAPQSEPFEREPEPAADPGAGLGEAEAWAARATAWTTSDSIEREALKRQRQRAWRARLLGRLG